MQFRSVRIDGLIHSKSLSWLAQATATSLEALEALQSCGARKGKPMKLTIEQMLATIFLVAFVYGYALSIIH
jgi:hypothetical protein